MRRKKEILKQAKTKSSHLIGKINNLGLFSEMKLLFKKAS